MTWNSLFVTLIGRERSSNALFSAEFTWRISAAILALLSVSLLGAFQINKTLALDVLGWTTLSIYWPTLLMSHVHNGQHRITPLLVIDIGDKNDVIRLIKEDPKILG